MTQCDSQYETVCKGEFAEVHAKLDRLDEAIRGNGKPGMQLRIDRLENHQKAWNKVVWLVLGSVATLAVSSVWQRIVGG